MQCRAGRQMSSRCVCVGGTYLCTCGMRVYMCVCTCVCMYVRMCGLVQNKERLALLRTATDNHQTLYMDAMVGKGVLSCC